MARSLSEIQAEMDAQQAAEPTLSQLNSPSQTSIYKLWKYITAYCILTMEKLWDLFRGELETTIANAPVGTNQWVRSKVFEFQYDVSVPQTLVIDENFAPRYQVVDESLRIVTRCSSTTSPGRFVQVKVAKNEPPEALDVAEVNSLKGYINKIGFAGVEYVVTSAAADKLFLEANIYYDGQYSGVIQDNVIAAVENYLANLDFDGIVYVSKLQDAIQAVTGVKDVVILNMAVRADQTSFDEKTYMVRSSAVAIRSTGLYAGYVEEETTSGEGFSDKLNFVVA